MQGKEKYVAFLNAVKDELKNYFVWQTPKIELHRIHSKIGRVA